MSQDTLSQIESRIAALDPIMLSIDDESHLHAGHAGAREGGGHYRMRIVSQKFCGLSRVARHRLIYQTLGDLMQTRIHALALETLTPDES